MWYQHAGAVGSFQDFSTSTGQQKIYQTKYYTRGMQTGHTIAKDRL